MKKILLFILLIVTCFSASAQVVISADKMNVVYAGLENPISISIERIKNKRLVVWTQDSIIKGNDGKYILKVPDSFKKNEVVVNVGYHKGKKTIFAASKTFRVKRIEPLLMLGLLSEGDYTKAKILEQKIVRIDLYPGFFIDGIKPTIKNFTIDVNSCSQVYTHPNTGPKLDSISLSYIEKANSGDRITISTDEYYGPTGKGKKKLVARYYIVEKKED